MESDRQIVITGNWKMNKSTEETVAFVKGILPKIEAANALIYLAVPFTVIQPAVEATGGSKLVIGAQNMHDATDGAFTGEIAGGMLKDVGARFVILGHSERRHIFNESNSFINSKIKRALLDEIQPVLCIGETLEEHESGKIEEVLYTQLKESLEDITPEQLAKMIIAYEPVWAIGTDKTATPQHAQDTHRLCRDYLADKWGKEVADKIVMQYGGSVKPENAKSLLEQPDIDGLLVGKASLNLDFFSQIVNYR